VRAHEIRDAGEVASVDADDAHARCHSPQKGIDDHEASELADLELETKSEDVLAEIERLQQRALKGKEPTS
jgi:hypothetical protein